MVRILKALGPRGYTSRVSGGKAWRGKLEEGQGKHHTGVLQGPCEEEGNCRGETRSRLPKESRYYFTRASTASALDCDPCGGQLRICRGGECRGTNAGL